MNRNLILICFIFIIFLFAGCSQQQILSGDKTKQHTQFCGGWDTFGEVICKCDGKYIKPSCPAGTVCDSGKYSCDGICGECKCYRSPVDKGTEIPCNGRESYFQ